MSSQVVSEENICMCYWQ